METAPIRNLAERYAGMPDGELVALALWPGDLLRHARRCLIQELSKRRLFLRLQAALAVELETLTEEQLDRLVAQVQKRPCPLCGGRASSLNAGDVPRPRHGLRAPLFCIGCTACLETRGVRGIPKPGPDGRTPPTSAMTNFVIRRAGLFIEFAQTEPVLDAVLALDDKKLIAALAAAALEED